MQNHRSVDVRSLMLGAVLVVVGFILGSISRQDRAQAQTVPPDTYSALTTKGPTLITASDDGKTLHFWSREPAGTNKPLPGRGFFYQGSRDSTEGR